ncbi:hypothetical protein [Azospirillum doebereinerae]
MILPDAPPQVFPGIPIGHTPEPTGDRPRVNTKPKSKQVVET